MLQTVYDAEGQPAIKYKERVTKTRKGDTDESRHYPPRMFVDSQHPERCPILLMEAFRAKRPAAMLKDSAPFYLVVNSPAWERGGAWYRSSAMGKNTIGAMMKSMCTAAGIEGRKTNHSVRKTSLTNLMHSDTPPTFVQKLSGHKNVNSLQNYVSPSQRQQKEMAGILQGRFSKFGAPENQAALDEDARLAKQSKCTVTRLPSEPRSQQPKTFKPQGTFTATQVGSDDPTDTQLARIHIPSQLPPKTRPGQSYAKKIQSQAKHAEKAMYISQQLNEKAGQSSGDDFVQPTSMPKRRRSCSRRSQTATHDEVADVSANTTARRSEEESASEEVHRSQRARTSRLKSKTNRKVAEDSVFSRHLLTENEGATSGDDFVELKRPRTSSRHSRRSRHEEVPDVSAIERSRLPREHTRQSEELPPEQPKKGYKVKGAAKAQPHPSHQTLPDRSLNSLLPTQNESSESEFEEIVQSQIRRQKRKIVRKETVHVKQDKAVKLMKEMMDMKGALFYKWSIHFH